ncbi:GlsB/YeaQ/YmgE family stress response membrane protein [Aestuariivirga sp.]|uniref:GlsB/YeaQ/YmgE family stress response membrane protein n=1 Tax=Aestuariivirga sp. TaxID=2650926 RepID=UPI0039E261E0
MNNLMDLGGGVGFFGTLLIGVLAGYIAEKVTKSNMGLIMNLICGIIGSYIGAFIANSLDLRLGEFFHGWFWGNLIVAAVGAIILILIARLIFGNRSRA